MATKIQELKWKLHCYKYKKLIIYGLKNGLIAPYNEELIQKLRKVYYGGIPASVILLSNAMTNGKCYDRALLMSQAFLDDEGDVKLLYATIDSLKLKPGRTCEAHFDADHCIVERITKDGRHFIYDTSVGLVFDKSFYWMIQNPKVRYVNNKESIKSFIEADEDRYPEDIDRDKYAAPLLLPIVEMTFGRPTEMYSLKGIELLQREIEHYKQTINYDSVVEEIDSDMKRLGFK